MRSHIFSLSGLIIKDILEKFYEDYITLSKKEKTDPKTGETKEVVESWSTNFREKITAARKKPADGKGRAAKKKKAEEFFEFVKDDILNVRTKERIFIKRIITSDKINPAAIMHLGSCFRFKAKIFKRDERLKS